MSKQPGQSLQEIGITLGLVALIAIPTLTLMGGQVNNSLNAVNNNSGELNQLAGLLGAPNGEASPQQVTPEGILFTGQNQIKLGPNKLTFTTNPNNGKLLFTTTSQNGTNTTSMDGSIVMETLAEELTALNNSQSIKALPKPVQEKIKKLSESAASIASAEKSLETFTLSSTKGDALKDPQKDFQALAQEYQEFGTQYAALRDQIRENNPALTSQLDGLVTLGKNIAYYNYLQPKSVKTWYSENVQSSLTNTTEITNLSVKINNMMNTALNTREPEITLAELSAQAGSQETQAISTEIGHTAHNAK